LKTCPLNLLAGFLRKGGDKNPLAGLITYLNATNMKKLLIALCVLFFAIHAKAQIYLQGGLNLANITRTNDGQTEKNNILTSFNAGIMGRWGLSKELDIETGLLFSGHGSRAETYFNGGSNYVKTRFNPYYIQAPLNAVIKIPLVKNANLFFHAGPYIAVGVGGRSRWESRIGPIVSTSSSSIKFSNDDPFTSEQDDAAYDKLKRFDYGLNAGAGIDFEFVILKLNYGLGLARINSTEGNNAGSDKNKYRTISLSVGIPLSR